MILEVEFMQERKELLGHYMEERVDVFQYKQKLEVQIYVTGFQLQLEE